MPRRSLRAGIVGGGFIAEVHARAIRAAGHEVIGIASSSEQSAHAAAERLRIPRSYATPQELIDAPEVDVIHVCTPNHVHAEISLASIAAGKPVVCEKPLATSVDDAFTLVSAAQAGAISTAVPFVYRYYPAVQEIRSRIAANEAGDLVYLHGSYLQDWLAVQSETNWRVDVDQGGGSRAFADIGVHWCDLMEFVTGHRITRLIANLTRSFDKRGELGNSNAVGNEDVASLMFETDHGAAGSLAVSQVSPGRKNRLRFSFDGTDASFEFDQESPDRVRIGGLSENRTIVSGSSAMSAPAARRLAILPPGHPLGYQDAFNALVADAYLSFTGEECAGLPTFDDGLRAAVLTEAVLLSSGTGEWVSVNSLSPSMPTS